MKENLLIDKSIAFAARIVKLHQHLIKSKKETVVSKQIVQSGTSIGANINEANYGQSKADFISKMHIALKETAETEYWIKLLFMSEYIDNKMSNSLLDDCLEIKRILIASINTAKENNKWLLDLLQKKVFEWWEIHKQCKDKLTPNRKSGKEVLEYLSSKYLLDEFNEEKGVRAVVETVLNNDFQKQKLPPNSQPEPKTFILRNEGNGKFIYDKQEDIWEGCPIFIGIDLSSGYVQIEGSCLLYDEIYAFQGMDEYDIENCVRVAEYIDCVKRFNPKLYNEICGRLNT